MKKGKYIDYNIILACLSHKRKTEHINNETVKVAAVDFKRIIQFPRWREEQQVA